MLQKLLGRNAKVTIFLETVKQEIFNDRGCTIGYRRTVILDNSEERRHGIQEMIRGFTLQEFDYNATHTPMGNSSYETAFFCR